MFSIGQFTPSQYAAPAAPLTLYNVNRSYAYVRFLNNSPYKLSVLMDGVITIVGEFFDQYVEIKSWFSGTVTITPALAISSGSHSQANVLTIEGYYASEVYSPQSQAIPQQAVTATATGKPLFSAQIGFASTVTTQQGLNIYNPANSGVVATFHSARAFTTDASSNILLVLKNGADKNLAQAVTPVSHTGVANPPVSVMHCTADDSAFDASGSIQEALNLTANVEDDVLEFPDNSTLYPGNNLLLVFGGAIGKRVHETLKWTEDTVVPPIPISGGVNVASSVVNDNNPASTTVLEATAQGDSPSDVLIQNTGAATFKGLMTLANQLKLTGSASPAIDASTITGAVVLKLLAGSISRIWVSGALAIAVAGTSVSHGLGVIPDFVVGTLDEGAAGTGIIGINYGTMSSTTFTALCSVASTCRFIAIKL